jgi:hypothetical protein
MISEDYIREDEAKSGNDADTDRESRNQQDYQADLEKQREDLAAVYLRHLQCCPECAEGPPLCGIGQHLWADNGRPPDNTR